MTPVLDAVRREELRKLSEGATPGEWTWGAGFIRQKPSVGFTFRDLACVPLDDYDSPRWNADAAYIAAMSPDTTLALLAYIAELEAGPKVKPLVLAGTLYRDVYECQSEVGTYVVYRTVAGEWIGSLDHGATICRDTEYDKVAAACQADYDQRIRSALAATPAARAAVLEPSNKVYLAARYSRAEELRGYRQQLLAAGFGVTSRWIDGGHELTKDGSVQAHEIDRQRFAMEDYADCDAADIVISFTEEPRKTTTRGGRHVEYGVALKGGKRALVIGHRENVFHCLPQAEFYPDFAAALAALKEKT